MAGICTKMPPENGEYVAKRFYISNQMGGEKFGCHFSNEKACIDLKASGSSIQISIKSLEEDQWNCNQNSRYELDNPWISRCHLRYSGTKSDPTPYQNVQEFVFFKDKASCENDQDVWFKDRINEFVPPCDIDPQYGQKLGPYLRGVDVKEYTYKKWP
ncbi:MAG TPA: hypothetical protein V6C65_28985 [Allocoleopsis sp.]